MAHISTQACHPERSEGSASVFAFGLLFQKRTYPTDRAGEIQKLWAGRADADISAAPPTPDNTI
jgi:hypothetical protein